jgi:S-DNA-T family DNA segregation ATPase FtsK/SpoIIIE
VECVGRAFAAEGLATRRIDFTVQHAWGRQLDIDLKNCTPAKVNEALAALDTHFDLPQGGTMVEPDQQRSSHITLRLVESNPFADMARPQVHAPRSLSVHDVTAMGRAMDGSTFELSFDGFCALVIGAMGAGKTLGALRTIAEALTACVDAVCWDLDPLKGGLAEFGDLMEVRARGPEECEEALERALSYVTARSKVMPRVGMGDRWYASEGRPDLYIFIDEYLQLSSRGKDLAIKILRTGRQYGIYLIMAGQEATADALGDAIANIVPYRILMACRFEDVRIAFGPGKGTLGWRPDRMEPSVGEIINDAGQSFIMGGGFTRAIRYRFNGYGRDQIVGIVQARVQAGVNRMDSDTLLEAGEGLSSSKERAGLAERLLHVDDARALKVAALLGLFEEQQTAFLPTAVIVDERLAADGADLQSLLADLVPGATATRQGWKGKPQVRGWSRSTVEAAANALLAPS